MPFRNIGQGPGNCETGQVSGLIGNIYQIYGCGKALNTYYCLPVTVILFEKTFCWPLNRGKKAVNNNLATAKRWPRALDTGGR